MKVLLEQWQKLGSFFEKGRPLAPLASVYKTLDDFLLTPGQVAQKAPYVRDAIDIKRIIAFTIFALLPTLVIGIVNTGYQILVAKGFSIELWQCIRLGSVKVFPILFVSYLVGGFWEVVFAGIRKYKISESFWVTGMLFALILPPTIPLWQVAAGISFGVIFCKGFARGIGYNVFNPALVAWAFVFFVFPAQMAGPKVWVAVDGYARATPLAVAASTQKDVSVLHHLAKEGYDLHNMFLGLVPGFIGETSALACLAGLAFLLLTRLANWRTVVGCVLGLMSTAGIFYLLRGTDSLTIFALPPHWHLFMGGFSFGVIFLATDVTSSPLTGAGRWIYGFLIGILTGLMRVLNPVYAAGMILPILFMNAVTPVLDHFVVQANIKKRQRRSQI